MEQGGTVYVVMLAYTSTEATPDIESIAAAAAGRRGVKVWVASQSLSPEAMVDPLYMLLAQRQMGVAGARMALSAREGAWVDAAVAEEVE